MIGHKIIFRLPPTDILSRGVIITVFILSIVYILSIAGVEVLRG